MSYFKEGFEGEEEIKERIDMIDKISSQSERIHELEERLAESIDALEWMQKATDEWAAEFTQKKRGMDWGVVNTAYCKASAVIAKARKEKSHAHRI